MSLPNKPASVSGLDGVGAEMNPDKLVRDYVFNQTIYRFGLLTCESWYNSESESPPIDRIINQQFSVGLGAIHSVINTDKALYWLGDDKCIYRAAGGIYERVSDDALSNTIERMSVVNDAIGQVLTLQGQDFYIISFPSEGRTFVNNEALGVNGWFELSSGNDDSLYLVTSFIEAYGKTYVCSKGKLSILDLDTYEQNGAVVIKERITQSINSTVLGVDEQRVKMSRLELSVETGVGLMTGQGENPRLLIETSIDGGRSYKHSAWVELGRLGEHTKRVELFQMLSGMDFIFRITCSDPIPLSIYGATIDIKLMGR
jgi:hypothetical protein